MVFDQEREWEQFRKDNPQYRFYEALRIFSGADCIILEKGEQRHDTLYWQDVKCR